MKKKDVKYWLKWATRYLLPILLGWLEGDTHVVADGLAAMIGTIL